jgi:anaerobic ribonucleoside-triphosphate reductase activating protein
MSEYNIKYGNIKPIDSADGEGVRVSLFVSGCNFHCKGCHNYEAWDFNYGKDFTEETMNEIYNYLDKSFISGFSVLGGEPLDPKNVEAVKKIINNVKNKFPDKNIWLWTGYDFEKLITYNILDIETLKNIDVLIDGQFILERRNLSLLHRGSDNQRVIDLKKTLPNVIFAPNPYCSHIDTDKIVLYCK